MSKQRGSKRGPIGIGVGAVVVVLAVVVAWAQGGCARITSTTTFTHTPVSRKTSMEVVAGSVEYRASSQLQGRLLLVTLRRAETCRTTVVPTLRKEAHTRRQLTDSDAGTFSSPVVSLLVGLSSVGLGAFFYVDAERLAASSSDEAATPDDYRESGAVLGGAGVGLLGIALIDALRLRDSHEVVGEVQGEPEVTSAQCREGLAPEAALQVTAPGTSWKEAARTDAKGKVSIDLLALEERAFVGGGLPLRLSIDGREVRLELAAAQAEPLLAQLAADPTSRVSQDREAKQRAECESKVAGARAHVVEEGSTDEDVADAERAWQRAEELCGARWRPEHGEARDALRARITSTAKARASARCEAAAAGASVALAERFDGDEPLQLDELYAEVVARCQGAANGAAVTAAWARKKVLIGAAEELDAHLERHDAIALRGQLRQPELAAALRREDWWPSNVAALAAYWIGALEGGGTSAPARAQLCAARALYLSFVGKAPWARLRAEVAGRNDVMKAAQLVRLLDGGGCK